MSVQAISWALSVSTGDPGAKIVLVTLANYADDKGRCWPSQATIAMQTEQSIDTVQRRLNDLEDLGLLARVDRRDVAGKAGGRYFYHLLIPHNGPAPYLESGPQSAVYNKREPQTAKSAPQNTHSAPQLCGTNHNDNRHYKREGFQDLREEKKEAFKAFPGSAEYEAWKAYYAITQKSMKRFLDRRELEGRPFEFESRWPLAIPSSLAPVATGAGYHSPVETPKDGSCDGNRRIPHKDPADIRGLDECKSSDGLG